MRPGFWRKCRVGFRWCRISALLILLAAVCAVVWFNQIGLPDFLKTRLVATLHERGIELQFSRLRLRFGRGLVAENVRIVGVPAVGNPSLTLAEAQLELDYRALLRRQWQLDGLVLRTGNFSWPLSPTNALRLDDIQADLRFQNNDTWSLDNFQAEFAGAKITLSGDVTNAPEIRDWEMFRRSGSSNLNWQVQAQKISDTLDRIHFDGTPLLNLTVEGDARDIRSFAIRLKAAAPAAQTPWFRAREIQLTANLTASAIAPADSANAWGFWTNAQPYQFAWSVRGTQLQSEKLDVDSIMCGGFWRAPELAVTNFSVQLGGGQLEAAATLNVATRKLAFTNSSCFDLHALDALLAGVTNQWLAKISLPQPPSLQIGGSLVLPAWTNSRPDWNGEVRPTLQLNGGLALTNGVVFGAKMDLIHAHFSCLDRLWQLTDLALASAKTRLEISGYEDDVTEKYRWRIVGALDPESARPFLTTGNAARGFEIVQFSEPLALDVNLVGHLHDYDSIAADGRVAVTNFTMRGEHFGDVTAAVNYTNRVLELLRLMMHTGAQMATADSVTLDFRQRLIFFTNGFSTTDPMLVTRAIGPKTAQSVEPYHFFSPPPMRVNGQILLGEMTNGPEMSAVDMRFDIIKGAPFQWRRLNTTSIMGTIFWRGRTLLVTNVTAAFYGGTANGFAYFDFRVPHEGADFNFAVDVTNANVHLLAADLSAKTNQLEGILTGQLVVTNASTMTMQSWNGYGHAKLHDGLLWDIPIVSILSPVLNTISPGLGNSRATEASAKFGITNGVGFTDSLDIRSTMTRLEYVGTIDLQENVNAHVTAHLLRDTPVIGSLVSTVFWPVSKLFEYRVTGPLDNPKSEPIYVLPKLLLFPLHPIRTLEDMIPAGGSVTNRPPAGK
jgi:AsmA-like C-terminal region